jgi:hypothetical protein
MLISLGSREVPLYPMILETSSLVNSTAFFGKELGSSMYTAL